MKRRDFIKLSLLSPLVVSSFGAFFASCGGGGGGSVPFPESKNPLNLPQDKGFLGYLKPQGRITIEASPDEMEIIPGKITRNLLTYKVNGYINPILVLEKEIYSV